MAYYLMPDAEWHAYLEMMNGPECDPETGELLWSCWPEQALPADMHLQTWPWRLALYYSAPF